ncbi:integral membrane protein [Lactobacillus plantarum subsp. plantarum ST-III] [Lacticaseibacillus rhamnosus]|nr:integral membrane protein [Lactobacillus plantarum subsp. plantarum ST-III] [Lacticaseibacillus rhamnosus]
MYNIMFIVVCFFFFQAEAGIRGSSTSRGLGDVYKRQMLINGLSPIHPFATWLLLTLTALLFMTIVAWLNLVFGKAGAFFSMVLLVLQLSLIHI